MPIYEYECTKCGEHTEVMQKITDLPLSKCTSCGGEVRKLITPTAFVLKGSGWYVTDYPSADRKKAMEAEKAPNKKKEETTKTSSTKKEETAKV
ncbi:MAG: zinc ribbon domain-containing protein [Nitrospirae bacterium]|nr:zinc ribbon domain-containing protein [Nitrospirota bacterium]